MSDFAKLIFDVIFATQDWHGGDAICLLEAPQGHIRYTSSQEAMVLIPYLYGRCCPPDKAELLCLLNCLLFRFSAHTWRGRCPPGYFTGIGWEGDAVWFRVWLASGQPGCGSGGAERKPSPACRPDMHREGQPSAWTEGAFP